ncbi:hypothetical protein V8G54_017935 [Vigna mungo]|uniref:Uncharacterized protein n=1 Tax=Vigna mungo TaxID=3915 RepID=A0AAQ3N7M8_VIGMU
MKKEFGVRLNFKVELLSGFMLKKEIRESLRGQWVWEKVLEDILESLGGVILVDSGYDKEVVAKHQATFGTLVTPETLKLHPIREFYEVCQKRSFKIIQDVVSHKGDVTNYRMKVEADGVIHQYEYIVGSIKEEVHRGDTNTNEI